MISAMDSKLKLKDRRVVRTKPIPHLVAKRIGRISEVSLALTLMIMDVKTLIMMMISRRISKLSGRKKV